MAAKKYKCPYCEYRDIRPDLIDHVEEEHMDLIPKGYTPSRVVYNSINKKDHGVCMVCRKETKWDENKQRYDSFCSNPRCRKEYVKIVRSRMVKKYGTYNLLTNPEFQKKMLENRSISGKYKFEDGGSVGYVGSYEKKFLEFMDKFLHIKSYDIMSPGPTIPYMYKGKEHTWITDYLYEPYNLVFDIKDGGDNPNTRDMKEYREKQIAKENAIKEYGDYNYIRLTDNKFEQLIEVMMELKERDNPKPLIKINESISNLYKNDSINEFSLPSLENINSYIMAIPDALSKIKKNAKRRLDIINNRYYLSSFTRINFDEYNIDYYKNQSDILYSYRENRSLKDKQGYIYLNENEYVCSIVVKCHNDMKNTIDAIDINKKYINHGLFKQLINAAIIDLHADYAFVNKNSTGIINILKNMNFPDRYSTNDIIVFILNNNRNKINSIPILVVCSYQKAKLSTAIVSITESLYSHASISLSYDLSNMYSFGPKGLQKEKIDWFIDKDSIIKINAVFLNISQYNKVYKELNALIDNKKTKYNYIGLIDVVRNKEKKTNTNSMICSEFVYYLLHESGFDLLKKSDNLVTPDDLSRLSDSSYINDIFDVYEGYAKNYDENLVCKRLDNLRNK